MRGGFPLAAMAAILGLLLGFGLVGYGLGLFGGGVRNCLKSALDDSYECSDSDGTYKQTTVNGVSRGSCSFDGVDLICSGSAPTTQPSSGICRADADCVGFASRNCGSVAVCDPADGLCHCCLPFVQGTSKMCIACTATSAPDCGGGPQYCIKKICAFKVGGYPSD